MVLSWVDPLLTLGAFLAAYGVACLLVPVDKEHRSGWLWSPRTSRRLWAAFWSFAAGPFLAAGAKGLLLWHTEGLAWPGMLWPFGLGCLVSGLTLIILVRALRSEPVPPPVKEFLSEWAESEAVGTPVVEVTAQPKLVRLRFDDSVPIDGEALAKISQLKEALGSRYSLVVWTGRQRRDI